MCNIWMALYTTFGLSQPRRTAGLLDWCQHEIKSLRGRLPKRLTISHHGRQMLLK